MWRQNAANPILQRHLPVFEGIAISNIAWPHERLIEALELGRELGVAGIEVAPFNVFGRWDIPNDEVLRLRARIEDYGLACPAIQGILFQAPRVALFEGRESRILLSRQLERVAQIASLLGARACVFGAPGQRNPGPLSYEQATGEARDFFAAIGPRFAERGTALAIEANAKRYGCRFLSTTTEAIEFVRAVDTPGIKLQIDTGTIFLEGEDPSVLLAAAPLAVHAHISEPQLQPLGTYGVDHSSVATQLKLSGYHGFVSVEMRATDDWQTALRRAVTLIREVYS